MDYQSNYIIPAYLDFYDMNYVESYIQNIQNIQNIQKFEISKIHTIEDV